MDIKHTADLPWENGLDVVNAMIPEFRDNLGPAELIPATYAKYQQKTLTIDPETTYRGDLIHLQAAHYADLTDAYPIPSRSASTLTATTTSPATATTSAATTR